MTFIGLDIGSISSKIVLINEENTILYQDYSYNNGNPYKNISKMFQNLSKNNLTSYNTLCTTGSGRKFIGKLTNSDLVKNEITTTWKAINHLYPNTKTIIEIGGQDSKLITLENKEVANFKLNSVCAAGTGSFIEQQANRLKISVDHLSKMALQNKEKAKFTGRCTVFVETEMVNLQQNGYPLEAIAAGLVDAICDNYLKDLTPGIAINSPIIFCGGVSTIQAVKESFEEKLEKKIIVPKINKITAAYGAALLAKELYFNKKQNSEIKILTLKEENIHPHSLNHCNKSDCLNCGKCFDMKSL